MVLIRNKIFDEEIERCGIIPYVIIDDVVCFCLAKDKKSRELGDFGGHTQHNENALQTGLRELREESRGVFDFKCKKVRNIIYPFTYNKMTIFFVKIDKEDAMKAVSTFRKRKSRCKEEDEICDIRWVDEDTFKDLVKNKDSRLWNKIKEFINNCCTDIDMFIYFLKNAKFFNEKSEFVFSNNYKELEYIS